MRRRHVLALSWATLLAGITGAQAKRPPWEIHGPPRMVLRTASGKFQRASLGTYCWDSGCADYCAELHPRRPLVIASGESLHIGFGRLGAMTEFSYGIWQVHAVDLNIGCWSDYYENEPVAAETVPSPTSPISLPNSIPPGLYVIDVFAYRDEGGDTSQGFTLRVLPDRRKQPR
ncbi:MAG: hypothetical protein U0031_01570 [Thermomicrobiales bacterium]